MSRGELKSAAINFRVPVSFRQKVEQLAEDTGWDVSAIARFILVACWEDGEALVRASGSMPPAAVEELREFINLCRTAQERGIDPRKTLADALEARLATAAPPAAA